jgi:hypothetical protein
VELKKQYRGELKMSKMILRMHEKTSKRWGQRVTMLMLVVLLAIGQWNVSPATVDAAGEPLGATYFTDEDNWGGGIASTAADSDMDVGIKNQNKVTADNYGRYPVEFKIEDVDKLPTKSAQLLIRGLDVDEYIQALAGNGEWDRVYFSSNPADIAFGAPYTDWLSTPSAWVTNIAASGIAPDGLGYKNEITEGAYLGALSGKDSKWSTSVLTFKPEEWGRIALGDNYVGVTIHHYYQDIRTATGNSLANTNWQMTLDWGQLVIDGGTRSNAEITEAGLKVESGKVTIDTSFIPKVTGSYSMEVNVIERTLVNGEIVERSVGLNKKLFDNSGEDTEYDWEIEFVNDPTNAITIDPTKEYAVNIMLFDDRGNGVITENYTNPGFAQHIVSFSTHDPIVADITKSGWRSAPTEFTPDDFKEKYFKVNGNEPNGDNLESVKIITLPVPTKGVLMFDSSPVDAEQVIPVGDLNKLSFVPVVGGFDGTVDFLWNGYNGERYAPEDATVTINSSPEVQDISVFMKVGEPNFPFSGNDNFIPHYIDPGSEDLVNVKIVTLPDPLIGKLVLDDGVGGEADVTENQVINVVDLDRLKFIPVPDVTGNVTFNWNGSDGLQYALVDKTVTIKINTPPVVDNVMKTGLVGSTIEFTKSNFAIAPAYADIDSDELTHVKIELPGDFADSGTLKYTSTLGIIEIAPGTTAHLTTTELNSLQFVPVPGLETDVTFPWYGSDGMHFSDIPADVIITYNHLPIAEPLVYDVEEGIASITIVLEGSDSDPVTVTGVTYGSVITAPLKGILTQDPTDPSGLTWTYTPNSGFELGTDSFTYTVKDEDGNFSLPALVNIHINKELDGWVGNKLQGDPTIVKVIPGQPLKLTAISSQFADKVTALVDGEVVLLNLVNPSTFAVDGYKKWENTTFVLPSITAPGLYTVPFTALDGAGDVLQTESKLTDNKFQVVEANLTLTAIPERILGDGVSTTELTATLLDENGDPIAGVEVEFTAPPAVGQFIGPVRVLTDTQGKAKVTYQSALMTGVIEQNIQLLATVNDADLGLSAQDDVTITFMPASIKGIITNGVDNTPVAGATVKVTLDLNGDGVITPGIDFIDEIDTKADGSYYFVVPKGDAVYDLEVTQLVVVGGVDTPVTYHQTAKVGTIAGIGGEDFDSEETVTGIILFKQPNGQSVLLSNDILNNSSVYLKKSDGSYVSNNGTPIAFPLNNQGVFNADGLAVDDYELEVRYKVPNTGEELVISHTLVSITATGEMNIIAELVDPYGTITDAVTHQTIEGAKVVLHYANTPRNIGKGLTPGATVTVPPLVGFAPNDNDSPVQLSDVNGFYAYMVYPETDYYLVVTKTGYNTYTSPTLSVEWAIVKHDLALTPIQSSGSGSSGGSVIVPSVSLNLSVDKNKVKEGEQSEIKVSYKNESSFSIGSGEIKVTLPAGAVIIDPAGGTVTGNTIVWKVANLSGGKDGSFMLVVKWPLSDGAEKIYDIPGEFIASSASAKSSVKINVYSDRFGDLMHYRYIVGFPDKEFKPNNSMTRAEVAAIVARLTENVDIEYELPFKDIRPGHWATNYIKIAMKHGYFGSNQDGLFRPDEPITRGELAAVMARFLKLEVSKPTKAHFSDTSGHWAGNIIEALYNGKFLSGYTNGTFKPNNAIIRVEAVTMINRMLYRGPLLGFKQLFPDMPTSHWGFGEVQEATVSHEAVRNADGSETWTKSLSDDMK